MNSLKKGTLCPEQRKRVEFIVAVILRAHKDFGNLLFQRPLGEIFRGVPHIEMPTREEYARVATLAEVYIEQQLYVDSEIRGGASVRCWPGRLSLDEERKKLEAYIFGELEKAESK